MLDLRHVDIYEESTLTSTDKVPIRNTLINQLIKTMAEVITLLEWGYYSCGLHLVGVNWGLCL